MVEEFTVIEFMVKEFVVRKFGLKSPGLKYPTTILKKAPWNETEVIEICQAKWKVKPRVKMADIMYGARELHGASNIIFR